MSKSQFVTGLRAVEQLLANRSDEVKKLLVEYRTANPRVEAVIERAKELGVEFQEANRARLKQISGEVRHQGLVAEIKRSPTVDEAGLRTLVEERLTEYPSPAAPCRGTMTASTPTASAVCHRSSCRGAITRQSQ